jgi:hypothetical protein
MKEIHARNHSTLLKGAFTFLLMGLIALIQGCGGGAGDAACVAAVGALSSNACKNSTTTTTNTVITPLTVGTLSFTVTENQNLSSVLAASNTNGGAVTYAVVSNPLVGTISNLNAATGAFTYTPKTNYYGQDSFTFNISNGSMTSNTGVVNITISQAYTAPKAVSASLSTNSSGYATGNLSAIDLGGYSLTYMLTNGASTMTTTNGTVTLTNSSTGAFTYQANAGATSDSFTFEAYDGYGYSNIATISITVNSTTPPTITWQSQGVIGIYNNYTAPNINNVNVQLSATCSSGAAVSYVPINSLPSGLTLSSTGLLSGATPAVQSITAYDISVGATCLNASTTRNTNPMFLVVMPPNIMEFTTSAAGFPYVTSNPYGLSQFGYVCSYPSAQSVMNNSVTNAVTNYCKVPTYSTTPTLSTVGGYYLLTLPSYVTSFEALVVGGGGQGAGGATTSYNGAGGSGGGFQYFSSISITPSQNMYVNVGLGGTGQGATGTTGAAGAAGYASTISENIIAALTPPVFTGILVNAPGGNGGSGSGASGATEPQTNAIPPFTNQTVAGGTVVLSSTEGGGGGASGQGGNPAGGLGAPSNITGSYVTYATGGAGGSCSTASLGVACTTMGGNDGNGGNGGAAGSGGAAGTAGTAGDPGVVVISF